jgi:hypothetical protein
MALHQKNSQLNEVDETNQFISKHSWPNMEDI